MTATEPGPTSRELGFTEPAVKITVLNKSSKDVKIKGIIYLTAHHNTQAAEKGARKKRTV